MKSAIIAILLILLSSSVACAADNLTINDSTVTSILPVLPHEVNTSEPIPDEQDHEFSEADSFDEYDAGSDMVAKGVWDKGPTLAANEIYDSFGTTRGFINSYITYNIDPEKIPVAKDYNNMNTTMAVILAILFIIGEGVSVSAATANYPAYRNAFGDKDFSQQKYAGGGISVIAGLGASWIFRGVMTLINLVDAYMMVLVMDAIKPSLDNGTMYLLMAIIELVLLVFFIYRQIIIVGMYIAAPIYGVAWASGYFKEFVDSIGDKVLRALIMQPLCIFVTTVFILVLQVMELDLFGVKVWDADNSPAFYIILLGILLYTCYWCLFSDMKLVKRVGSLAVKKAVYAL